MIEAATTDGGATNDLVVYTIDPRDRIIAVNEAWHAFANTNGGPAKLYSPTGRSLWDLITDTGCQTVYQLLLEGVRAAGEPVTFAYRCDTPTVRRHMRMTLDPLADGSVTFHSRVMAREPLDFAFHVSPSLPYNSRNVNICSFCRKIRLEERWAEATEAFASGFITERHNRFRTIYRICPSCKATMERETSDLLSRTEQQSRVLDEIMARYHHRWTLPA